MQKNMFFLNFVFILFSKWNLFFCFFLFSSKFFLLCSFLLSFQIVFFVCFYSSFQMKSFLLCLLSPLFKWGIFFCVFFVHPFTWSLFLCVRSLSLFFYLSKKDVLLEKFSKDRTANSREIKGICEAIWNFVSSWLIDFQIILPQKVQCCFFFAIFCFQKQPYKVSI